MNGLKRRIDMNSSLLRGTNREYPLAFIDSGSYIKFQTTRISADGTPRYCVDGTRRTYHIASLKNSKRGLRPIWGDRKLESIWEQEEKDMGFIEDLKELYIIDEWRR